MTRASGERWILAALICTIVAFGIAPLHAQDKETPTASPAPSQTPAPEGEGDAAAAEEPAETKLATPEEFRSYLEAERAAIAREREALFALRAEVKKEVEHLQTLQSQMDARMTEIDAEYEKKVKKLIQIYAVMTPEEAKARMSNLEEDLMLRVIYGMKPKQQAAILALFPPAEAAKISEKILKKKF